jgi:hypothetical protein
MKNTAKLTRSQRIKSYIWHKIYFAFPWLQSHLLKWHLVWHDKGRQKYHIGYLDPSKTLQELEKHLHENWGFGNHFIAWVDDGQVLSWRKLVDFDHQYHLRVFEDGEIRGHFEYTPESKPIAHFAESNEEGRIEEFKKFLEGFLVEEKPKEHLVPDVNVAPESEITVDSNPDTK